MTHEMAWRPLAHPAPQHKDQSRHEHGDHGLGARVTEEPTYDELAHPREHNERYPHAEPILEIDSQESDGDIELSIDRMEVIAHGALGQEELLRNGMDAVALYEQAKDL